MQRLADIAPAEVRTIWGLLSAIPDPEVPVLTITDLGMVRSVARHGDGWVIGFTPTYSGCPATEHLLGGDPHGHERAWLSAGTYRPAAGSAVDHRLDESGCPRAPAPVRHQPAPGHACHADMPAEVSCPRCGSAHTSLISEFGSTACKALYRCDSCREPLITLNVFEVAMTTFYSLKVARVEPETRDAVTITLRSRKPCRRNTVFARASI